MDFVEVKNLIMKSGMELKVNGVFNANPERFSINVGHSTEEIAVHVDVRFSYLSDKRQLIINHKTGDAWQEEQRDARFPFTAGQAFQVSVVFNFDTFDIYLPDGQVAHFTNHLGAQEYKYIFFVGDATVKNISVNVADKPTKR
uniref:Galactose-binding lectin l-1 n=2 Tax=Anguilla japonica TaxID=7937 RepID=AJL1_ANGJA|nr:RecName: Full=Galactose-binding lectin l-1; Short=Galectin; AltName: Full=Ajl-1 [Anguilla japonica]BAC67210.1 galectin [Anguilla japonica]BAX25469.1 galectin [Anguilla japonica]